MKKAILKIKLHPTSGIAILYRLRHRHGYGFMIGLSGGFVTSRTLIKKKGDRYSYEGNLLKEIILKHFNGANIEIKIRESDIAMVRCYLDQ